MTLPTIKELKLCWDIPIIDYSSLKVYCIGYFRFPTLAEINSHSKMPFAIFEPAEPHGWKISLYSLKEVLSLIKGARKI